MATGSLSSLPVRTTMVTVVSPPTLPFVKMTGTSSRNGAPIGTTTLMEFLPTFSNATVNENGAPGLPATLSQLSWVSPRSSPSGSSVRSLSFSVILFSRFSPAKMSWSNRVRLFSGNRTLSSFLRLLKMPFGSSSNAFKVKLTNLTDSNPFNPPLDIRASAVFSVMLRFVTPESPTNTPSPNSVNGFSLIDSEPMCPSPAKSPGFNPVIPLSSSPNLAWVFVMVWSPSSVTSLQSLASSTLLTIQSRISGVRSQTRSSRVLAETSADGSPVPWALLADTR